MGKQLALFCILHPATVEKKERLLTLFDSAKSYYQSPESKCTTWSYFTPSQHLKVVPSDIVPVPEKDTLIAGMEIYTDKSALPIQTESTMFKDFHTKVEAEQVYAKDEELVAWYPVGGFVSRGDTAGPFGGGVFVLTSNMVCKEGQRDRLVSVLSEYAEWVKQNEPGFLTYSIMTRPKAPNEVLLFERCTGQDAFRSHISSASLKNSLKSARQYIKRAKGQEWTELDNAFVGNVLGGKESTTKSKL